MGVGNSLQQPVTTTPRDPIPLLASAAPTSAQTHTYNDLKINLQKQICKAVNLKNSP